LFTRSPPLPWGKYLFSPLGLFQLPGGNIPPVPQGSSATPWEIFLLSARSLSLP
jgi:hypothetical protein